MENNPMAMLVGVLLLAVLAVLMLGLCRVDGCSQNDFFGSGPKTVDQSFR